MLHELIHYYQDMSGYYPDMASMGRDKDTRVTSKGFANLEFETMLIDNIRTGIPDNYLNQLKESKLLPVAELAKIRDEYNDFLKSFKDSQGKLRDIAQMDKPKLLSDYSKFLDLYATKSKDYRSEIFADMEPKALLDLLKYINEHCKN